MVFTFHLMNDTIFLTILTAVPMVLHRTMVFGGSLLDTWHSVDPGCVVMIVILCWKPAFQLDV